MDGVFQDQPCHPLENPAHPNYFLKSNITYKICIFISPSYFPHPFFSFFMHMSSAFRNFDRNHCQLAFGDQLSQFP